MYGIVQHWLSLRKKFRFIKFIYGIFKWDLPDVVILIFVDILFVYS